MLSTSFNLSTPGMSLQWVSTIKKVHPLKCAPYLLHSFKPRVPPILEFCQLLATESMLYEHLIRFLLTYKKTDSLELRSRITMSHFHFFVCLFLVCLVQHHSNMFKAGLFCSVLFPLLLLGIPSLFKTQTSSIISDGMLCSCVGGGTVL